MQYSSILAAAIIGSANLALAQGVTQAISPPTSAPAGCQASYPGTFEITVAQVQGATKRDLNKRADCSGSGTLVSTLEGGILKDSQGRTGYIASNYQFQYDNPPQAGAIYTAGFSACANGSLALGGSPVFWECQSGDFYNLYDRNWAPQCMPVEIVILPCGGSGATPTGGAAAAGTTGAVSQISDGQIIGTQVMTTTIVSALSDGQPQVKTVTTPVPMCKASQISDGQVQYQTTPCPYATPVTSYPVSMAPVSQKSDGQINVTPTASVPTLSYGSSKYSSYYTSTATSAPVVTAGADKMSGKGAAFMVGLVGAAAFL